MIEAGRELDALIAEKVLGWTHHPPMPGYPEMWFLPAGGSVDLPFFSTDIAAAWQVVDKLRPPTGAPAWTEYARTHFARLHLMHLNAAEAAYFICIAALAAEGVEV